MASPIKEYLGRSLGLLRRNTARMVRMDVAPAPPPLTLFSFTSRLPPVTPISSFALGSDSDIGGLSTCSLMPVPSSSSSSTSTSTSASPSSEQSHIAFSGNLSLRVPPAYAGRIRTGYAAFRNKTRPTLFGEDTWDLELFTHLKVVLAYRGWDGWRGKWVVNLQTDGPVRSDLFQHRLDLPPSPASTSSRTPTDVAPVFTTVHLPLSSFVLTNSGQTSATQIPMLRGKIRTIGFGLLGGGRVDDGTVAPPTTNADAGRRLAAGGWGKAGADEDIDAELEELMASDRPARAAQHDESAPAVPRSSLGQRAGAAAVSGYHRVGSAASAPAEEPPVAAEPEAAVASEGGEGYYELCVQSVEAVRYDPEAEE